MAVEVYGAGGTEKTKQTKTVTPSTSLQQVTADSEDYELEQVNVQAMPAGLMSDITVSTSGLITSKIGTSGYLAQNTSKTKQLSTVAAQSYMPGTEDREIIASGKYTTGSQNVKGDANLLAENIKKGKTIFNVAGSLLGNTGTHIWERYPIRTGNVGQYETRYAFAHNQDTSTDYNCTVYYSDSYNYNESTHKYSFSSYSNVQQYYGSNLPATFRAALGNKYVLLPKSNYGSYIPTQGETTGVFHVTDPDSITYGLGTDNKYHVFANGWVYEYRENAIDYSDKSYAISTDESEYPDDGIQDGYYYKKIVIPEGNIFSSGTITLSSAQYYVEIPHNLGVLPDYIMIQRTGQANSTTSRAFYLNYGTYYGPLVHTIRGTAVSQKSKGTTKNSTSTWYQDTEVFTIPAYSTSYGFSGTYMWIAGCFE